MSFIQIVGAEYGLYQLEKQFLRRRLHIMSISQRRIEEIRNFKDTDFSDAPILTDEQLSQMKPCHLLNNKSSSSKDSSVTVRIDTAVLDTL